MSNERPLTLRRLAARVAVNQRIRDAVVGAIEQTLPLVIEDLLSEFADDEGGTLRLYRRKRPQAKRLERDARIRDMLARSVPPKVIATEVRCSLAHVYNVRVTWQSNVQDAAEPAVSNSPP